MERRQGLTGEEARKRLLHYGPNSLPYLPARTLGQKLLAQFHNPLIYILLCALAIDTAAWLYEGGSAIPVETIAILLILMANATLGLWQDSKSETALQRLKQLSAPQSWVYRDGKLQRIESSLLVPGDQVRVEAGERIPADGITLQEQGFLVDESVMTGESLPVDVAAGTLVLSGTLAVRGMAILEVTKTGKASNMGKLAELLQEVVPEKTPLEKRLEAISRKIAIAVVAIALLLLACGITLAGLDHFSHLFLFAVALAVAAVPESLPAVITLALALGVERMAKRKAVVRKLSAVEALGSVTVIATDKTGTLTENRMAVHAVESDLPSEAFRAMALANDADLATLAGDPLETGMLRHLEQQQAGLASTIRNSCRRIGARPFDAEWKFMRCTVESHDGIVSSYLKGAPEVLLERSRLSAAEKQQWQKRIHQHASEGHRAIALAKGEGEREEDLHFLGLVLLFDPPRPEVPGAIRAAQEAGVRVVMITGDHPATALAIGRQIGISSSRAITGEELDAIPESQWREKLRDTNIYARTSPQHKLKIVRFLQAQGEVVAVTGDGVNDAPALKAADVGIAMGQRGSDVSREVADLILLDDNFATITAAMEEGRNIYENIQKVIRFLFAHNFTEVFLITIASVVLFLATAEGAGFLLPLTAAQILWINLVTDSLPAIAIIADNNPGVLRFRPRPAHSPLLDRESLLFILVTGGISTVTALGILFLSPGLGISTAAAQAMAFCYLTLALFIFVDPSRKTCHLPQHNPYVTGSLLLALLVQVAAMLSPDMRQLLGTAALSPGMAVTVALLLLLGWIPSALTSQYLREKTQSGTNSSQGY